MPVLGGKDNKCGAKEYVFGKNDKTTGGMKTAWLDFHSCLEQCLASLQMVGALL